jgi:hypothetical protein
MTPVAKRDGACLSTPGARRIAPRPRPPKHDGGLAEENLGGFKQVGVKQLWLG